MKVSKTIRLRYNKQLSNHQKLQIYLKNKEQQEKIQKQNFFRQLTQQIKKCFDEQSLQIFQQYAQNVFLVSKNKKNKYISHKKIQSFQNVPKREQINQIQNKNDIYKFLRKLDSDVLEWNKTGIIPNSMTYRFQNKQRFVSTPKLKKSNNLLVGKKMIQLQKKMKKNYERLKYRVLGQNNHQKNSPCTFIRKSLEQTTANQNRKIRFKTESRQTAIYKMDHIPNMLLNDIKPLQKVSSRQKIYNFEDRRLQCFQLHKKK